MLIIDRTIKNPNWFAGNIKVWKKNNKSKISFLTFDLKCNIKRMSFSSQIKDAILEENFYFENA